VTVASRIVPNVSIDRLPVVSVCISCFFVSSISSLLLHFTSSLSHDSCSKIQYKQHYKQRAIKHARKDE